MPHLNIVLPIGISFYTFHTITYIVDSYRGVIKPTRNFFEFATYVSLFSQLVAGPIVRFRQIEEDLESIGQHDAPALARARALVLRHRPGREGAHRRYAGGVRRSRRSRTTSPVDGRRVAGDARLHVSAVLRLLRLQRHGGRPGLLFGLRIPQNFNSPYKAIDPVRFLAPLAHLAVERVCATISTFRSAATGTATAETYRNLDDHDAARRTVARRNWTFVVWGAYHGVLLSVYRRSARPGIAAGAVRQLGDVRASSSLAGCSSARRTSRWRSRCCGRCSRRFAVRSFLNRSWPRSRSASRRRGRWPGRTRSTCDTSTDGRVVAVLASGFAAALAIIIGAAHFAVPLLSVLSRRHRDNDSATREDIGR